MWHSYFFGLQKKYSARVSTKSPLVIRLDGKSVTKNKEINIIDEYKGSFLYAMGECAKYFTEKYGGYALFGSDEMSFIFEDPNILLEDLASKDENYSNELISLFSQYFYDFFNISYKENKVFWHAKCFSIPSGKINSYIKHRMKTIANVVTTYFLIKNKAYEPDKKLNDRIEACKKIDNFEYIKSSINGILYHEGKRINLEEFLNGKIIEEIVNNTNSSEVNIEDFDIEV